MKKTKVERLLKNKRIKTEGITLIALVITIIVLLILAGVSIATLTGDNGLLTKASQTKIAMEQGEVEDQIRILVSEYAIEKNEGIEDDFITWLQNKSILEENNKINIEALIGKTMSTGNGTATDTGGTDVYKLEEVIETSKLASTEEILLASTETGSDNYNVVYYDQEGDKEILDTFSLDSSSGQTTYPEASPEDIFRISEDSEGNITINRIERETGMFGVPYPILYGITDVVIPEFIKGKKVVGIEDSAVYWMNIKSIVIPYSVKTIGDEAFYIGNATIANCSDLTLISFPEGKNPELEIPANKWGATKATITGINGEILAE